MKNRIKKTLSLLILTISLLYLNQSCRSSEQQTASCFPNSVIGIEVNLNLPAYYALQNVGGWAYIDGAGSGTRGLIVVRTSSTGFMVYDRNAPHLCPDTNTTLNVEGGIKITCAKDSSEWILLTGQPTKVASVPPRTYYYNFYPSTNMLGIYK